MRGNPKKKLKKSEIAKKNLGRDDFGGSVGAQQTDKILRMALPHHIWSTEDSSPHDSVKGKFTVLLNNLGHLRSQQCFGPQEFVFSHK